MQMEMPHFRLPRYGYYGGREIASTIRLMRIKTSKDRFLDRHNVWIYDLITTEVSVVSYYYYVGM